MDLCMKLDVWREVVLLFFVSSDGHLISFLVNVSNLKLPIFEYIFNLFNNESKHIQINKKVVS